MLLSQEDKLLLKESKNGHFSLKLHYRALDRSNATLFPYSSIWNPHVLMKVGFFCLGSFLGKVLALDQLKRRVRTLANGCFLCGEEEEMVDHILVHFPKARMLWVLILALVGVK